MSLEQHSLNELLLHNFADTDDLSLQGFNRAITKGRATYANLPLLGWGMPSNSSQVDISAPVQQEGISDQRDQREITSYRLLSIHSFTVKDTTQPVQPENLEYEMSLLEIFAEMGDESKFLDALQQVNWLIRNPHDYVKSIKLALKAGAHQAARRLANEGAARFSNYEELQKYMALLAPPKVIRRHSAISQSLSSNNKWLAEHGKEFSGNWVALQDGKLLESSKSLSELTNKIGTRENAFFIKMS